MRYYDISVPISPGMPVYEGDPSVEVFPFSSIAKGDIANVLRLHIGTHTGTHIDAPLHFIDGGRNVCELSLDDLNGPALVIDAGAAEVITPETLASHQMKSIKRVLFKTRSSAYWEERAFRRDFVHLSGDAARLLVELGLRLVGIDYLSIEKFGSDTHEAHRTLLEAGVVALEGLNLSNVPAGMYELLCLPLAVAGGDGAPCRAILLEKEEAVCRIEKKTG